jgi:predicted Zn-dependent protease with MMP-like domain
MSDASAWRDGLAPSLDEVAALAQAAFEALPKPFREMAGQLVVRVEEFAADEVLDDLGIEDPFELTGLYQGVDLTRQSYLGPGDGPAFVFLYRRPILDEWVERGDVTLRALIAHVLTHEIGHHFGLSDEGIEAIESAAE